MMWLLNNHVNKRLQCVICGCSNNHLLFLPFCQSLVTPLFPFLSSQEYGQTIDLSSSCGSPFQPVEEVHSYHEEEEEGDLWWCFVIYYGVMTWYCCWGCWESNGVKLVWVEFIKTHALTCLKTFASSAKSLTIFLFSDRL